MAIPHGAFYHCKTLRKITLPARVTYVGISAFEGCTALHELSFPATLTAIGDFAFACCHVEGRAAPAFSARLSSTLPRSPTSICRWGLGPKYRWPAIWVILLTFSSQACCTSLTKLTLPATLNTISAVAFAHNTSLATITLPASLATIMPHAFAHCSALTTIAFPATLTTIDHRAFHGCISLRTKPTLPAALLKRHTRWVGQRPRGCSRTAFDGCSFAATIPFVGSFRGLRGWIHRRKLAVSSRGGDMSAVRKVSPEEEAYKYSAARFL